MSSRVERACRGGAEDPPRRRFRTGADARMGGGSASCRHRARKRVRRHDSAARALCRAGARRRGVSRQLSRRRSRRWPSRCGPTRWRICAGTGLTASTCAIRRIVRSCGPPRPRPNARRWRRQGRSCSIEGRRHRFTTAHRAAGEPRFRRPSGPAPTIRPFFLPATTMRAEASRPGRARLRRRT